MPPGRHRTDDCGALGATAMTMLRSIFIFSPRAKCLTRRGFKTNVPALYGWHAELDGWLRSIKLLLGSVEGAMKLRVLLAIVTGATTSIAAWGDETPSRVNVNLYQQCESDSVGQRLAFKIKEGLNRSTSMAAVDSYSEAAIHVSLVCLSPDPQERGSFSRYSYQITVTNFQGFYDFALTHGVGTCGTQRVSECADGIVANIDSEISEFRIKIKSGKFKWPN